MPFDLASAPSEVRSLHDECCDECRRRLQEELADHPVMAARAAAAPGQPMMAAIDFGRIPELVKFALDLTVQFAGQPLETLVVSQKDAIRQFVSQRVVDFVRQLANDISDHPVMGAKAR